MSSSDGRARSLDENMVIFVFVFTNARYVWSPIRVPLTVTIRHTRSIVWETWSAVVKSSTITNRSNYWPNCARNLSRITNPYGSVAKCRNDSRANSSYRICRCKRVIFLFCLATEFANYPKLFSFSLSPDARHDFKLVFGVDVSTPMTKAQRMLYGESAMTHAMVLTAVSLDVGDNFLFPVLSFRGQRIVIR